MGTPQVQLQNMTPKFSNLGAPSVPIVGLKLDTLNATEGSSFLVKITRKQVVNGDCSVGWRLDASPGVYVGAGVGVADFASGITERAFSIQTINTTGVQPDRQIAITLYDPVSCVIDPSQTTGVVLVVDLAAPINVHWWPLPNRSQRFVAGGLGYFMTSDLDAKIDAYESQVALCDAGVGWVVAPI